MSIEAKTKDAQQIIEDAMRSSKRQLVAFSGGKDSIVVAHIARQLGIRDFVCETSFYFRRQLDSIKETARRIGIEPVYRESLHLEWLKANRHIVFSNDSAVRGWTFATRQQRTVKRRAKEIQADCQIFGRRTEENCVKATLYRTSAGLQCHPIRDWKTSDVLEYLEVHGIPLPWIYSTRFGKTEGNAPFYTLNHKTAGLSIEQCWQLVESMDERYHKGIVE